MTTRKIKLIICVGGNRQKTKDLNNLMDTALLLINWKTFEIYSTDNSALEMSNKEF